HHAVLNTVPNALIANGPASLPSRLEPGYTRPFLQRTGLASDLPLRMAPPGSLRSCAPSAGFKTAARHSCLAARGTRVSRLPFLKPLCRKFLRSPSGDSHRALLLYPQAVQSFPRTQSHEES